MFSVPIKRISLSGSLLFISSAIEIAGFICTEVPPQAIIAFITILFYFFFKVAYLDI